MLFLLIVYGAILGYYFRPQIEGWKNRFLAVERAVVPSLRAG